MKRRAAAKKLDALTARVENLEGGRDALEAEAFGARLEEAQRRERYIGLENEDLRRKLIERERALHALRRQQHEAAVGYWQLVVDETRAKLEDLKSDSPTSGWRRDIWWDIATVFWILTGAGWLGYAFAGAAVGAALSAACGWYIVRTRPAARLTNIRKGEEVLRSSESELRQARQKAEQAPAEALFPAAENAAELPKAACD